MEHFENENKTVPFFYETFMLEADEFGFEHVGRLSIQFQRPSTWHHHEGFQVLTPLAGQGRCDLGNQEILLERGVGAVIPPGLKHRIYDPAGNGVMEVLNLMVTADETKAAGRFLHSLRGQVAVAIDVDRADAVCGELEAAFARDHAQLMPSLVASVWQILALYESVPRYETVEAQDRADPRLRIVESILHSRLDESLSVDYLAEQAGVSTSQLHRLYKQWFGQSLHRRLQEIRLAMAKDLLKYSNLRMNEIARRCGFKDATHFSFLFRKKEAMSPMEYRRAS